MSLNTRDDLVVIALGGNALGDTPQDQIELTKGAAAHIVDIIEQGTNVVVTHGNGPQVGMINNAFAATFADVAAKVPEMGFPECGSMSQGYIGYHITQAIRNELDSRGMHQSVVDIVTQTVVSSDDPAFQNPTKPIGPFMSQEAAEEYAEKTGHAVKEDSGRGWRRVVPSPKPQRIVEFDAVRSLVNAGYVVVCSGGGGIPVVETPQGLQGVSAVIDKDASASLLASELLADSLIILTAVDRVCVQFGKPGQREIDKMSIEQARAYAREGEFPAGSMLPKVEACIGYAEKVPEGKSIITSLEKAAAGLRGETGTVITSCGYLGLAQSLPAKKEASRPKATEFKPTSFTAMGFNSRRRIVTR